MNRDLEAEFDPTFDVDLDNQLRAFFRQAARPALPASLDLGPERPIPMRVHRQRFAWAVQAGLAAVSVLVAVALTGGLLLVRSMVVVAPGAGPGTPILLVPVSQNPHIDAMGRIDAKTGWVEIGRLDPRDTGFGEEYLRWTYDGGETWSEPRAVPITAAGVEGTVIEGGTIGFEMADASHGWTAVSAVTSTTSGRVGTTTLWRTSDGGLTWQPSAMPIAGSAFSPAFHFRNELHGEFFTATAQRVADRAAGRLASSAAGCERISTADGGLTWSAPQAMPCLGGISWVDDLFGYSYEDSTLRLSVTLDGGQTWTSGVLPFNVNSSGWAFPMMLGRRSDGALRSLAFDLTRGAADYAIVESRDAGRSWIQIGSATWDETIQATYGPPIGGMLTARDENHWLAAASRGTGDTPWFASNDGGLTWAKFDYTGFSGDAERFSWLNPSDGWASTQTTDVLAALWHTTDGGATWTKILDTP